MALTTWSAKIDDDQKEKLQFLIEESGLSVKDFLENLVSNYELNNAKIHVKEVAEDISEMQKLSQRINNIFINVAERIESIKSESETTKLNAIADKDKIIHTLSEKLTSLETSLAESKNLNNTLKNDYATVQTEHTQLKDHFDKETEQLREVNKNNQALIDQYKEKIDTLSSIVTEYQNKASKYDDLANTISLLEKNISKLTDQKAALETKLEIAKQNFKSEIDKLNKHHEEELILLKDKHIMELERNTLQAEKKHNEKLQKTQEEYNNKLLSILSTLQLSSNKQKPK